MKNRLALDRISHGTLISAIAEILRSILFWTLFIITGIIWMAWASLRCMLRFSLRLSVMMLVYILLGLCIAAAVICVLGYYAIILVAAQPRMP